MIQLHVTWLNPGHDLLSDPAIVVKADDVDLSPTSKAKGEWDYEIPDGATALEVRGTFKKTLKLVKQAAREFVLFDAVQHYTLDHTDLTPVLAERIGPAGSSSDHPVHPLIQTVSASSSPSGAALVVLRTEFLDVTEHFVANAPSGDQLVFKLDAEPASEFVALAATGCQPPLWFVHVPREMDPPSSEVSAMVFFRPHNSYGYSTATGSIHNAKRGLSTFGRYILEFKDDRGLDIGGKHFKAVGRWPYIESFIALRAGFQRAVVRSGKPLVMIHPWPAGSVNFGDALSSKLPDISEQIVRFLTGTHRICASQEEVKLGRFGISGYSAGGPPAAKALKANRTRVQELWLFDPHEFAPFIALVIDWATKADDFRLRMTGAIYWGQCATMRKAVKAGVSGEAGENFVTLKPEKSNNYEPVAKGGSPWWTYVCRLHPNFLASADVRHQFAIFGGDNFSPAPDQHSVIDYTTWLEEFITMSSF